MRDRSGMALVERIAEGDLEPSGMVTVELRNERGRVIDRETRPNFIAKTWKAHARARMRMQWMQFGYNRLFTGQSADSDSSFPYGIATAPIFPADMIACWNQTDAEDAANEHTPVVPATGLVAWATRYPFGSAVGARGNVNITDSFVDDDTVRHVFDWTSSQGNGTFRSVGWLRAGGNLGLHLLSAGTAQRTVTNVTWAASIITGGTGLYPSLPFIDPATGTTYVLMRRQAVSNVHRVVSFAGGSALAASGLSIVGTKAADTQAVSNVSGEFSPTAAVNNAAATSQCAVLGRLSGATVVAWDTNASVSGTHRWGVVNDAGTTATSYLNPTAGWFCGAVIGTTLYMSGNGVPATTGGIYTYNTGTGVLGSTIAMSAEVLAVCTQAGITTPRAHRMTTDGTYLYVLYASGTVATTQGGMVLVKLDTSGTLVQIIGVVPHRQTVTFQTDAASAPYAGTAYFGRSWWAMVQDYGGLSVDGSAGTSTVEDIFTAPSTTSGDTGPGTVRLPAMSDIGGYWYQLTMSYYDGSVFFGTWEQSAAQATTNILFWMRQGFDLGSRVLLSSSKTKTIGQTMRITYDITLPGWF